MIVAIILGNRMNNDGTPSQLMNQRLELAVKLDGERHLDKIIVSGGIANKNAGIAEADVMRKSLIMRGMDGDKIIAENKSRTTKENAKFSVPIALQLNADEIIICTTPEHMHRKYLNPVKLFEKQLRGHNVKLTSYCR
ncbi:MAG: YdcF family protein [Corallococcus sp.]|nr:YdcF family protein [Corallococcus sp.]